MSITCLIRVASVVFLAVLQPVAFKTNQGYKCLFTCLPTELVSSKKSQASAVLINEENGGVWQNLPFTMHKQAAYGINLASNIHQDSTNLL